MIMRKFPSSEAVIEGDDVRWINQIHRDDAARAIVHLLTNPGSLEMYNVSDSVPATQFEVYQWLADFFECALPRPGGARP
jgi:nucleoside-diphosphate-sugar epimerase